MPVSYDFVLVAISIMVAVVGSHAGFAIMRPNGRLAGVSYKARLLLSAVVFGGSIWAMHFIGMHAVQLPILINYALLPTFVSALVAILLTGLGLYIATAGVVGRHPRKIAAILMGGGITSMHYLGIGAIRANCVVDTSLLGGVSALAVGVVVAWFALRVMTTPRKNESQTLLAAVLLGIAISGMHYVAMADTRFLLSSGVEITAEPVLNEYYLASFAAFLAFLICDLFIFIVLPEPAKASPFRPEEDAAPAISAREISAVAGDAEGGGRSPAPAAGALISIEASTGQVILPVDALLSVKADGRYAQVSYLERETGQAKTLFSVESIAQLQERLPEDRFARVHRSHIVNLGWVARLDRSAGAGKLHFAVRGGPEVPVSRSYLKIIANRLAATS
ncbi:MAG: LytTR family transcriptional regulator DNA-binding domain-containing protein [Neomegalonema sp.]|nr:LytTR family transcriptional regulator DNA-binding domain-containing protein [Neomegalonema sp.]